MVTWDCGRTVGWGLAGGWALGWGGWGGCCASIGFGCGCGGTGAVAFGAGVRVGVEVEVELGEGEDWRAMRAASAAMDCWISRVPVVGMWGRASSRVSRSFGFSGRGIVRPVARPNSFLSSASRAARCSSSSSVSWISRQHTCNPPRNIKVSVKFNSSCIRPRRFPYELRFRGPSPSSASRAPPRGRRAPASLSVLPRAPNALLPVCIVPSVNHPKAAAAVEVREAEEGNTACRQ